MVYVAVFSVNLGDEVHLLRKAQITYWKADEAFSTNFAKVFSPKLVAKLPKHTEINNHAIKLVNNEQPPYGPIYSRKLVEFRILKLYIENNLVSGFIRPSKSLVKALIFFDKKPDRRLRLLINYQGFNNLTIKNLYLLFFIGKSLDQLDWAQHFT